jgi:hypothetical protein
MARRWLVLPVVPPYFRSTSENSFWGYRKVLGAIFWVFGSCPVVPSTSSTALILPTPICCFERWEDFLDANIRQQGGSLPHHRHTCSSVHGGASEFQCTASKIRAMRTGVLPIYPRKMMSLSLACVFVRLNMVVTFILYLSMFYNSSMCEGLIWF